MSKLIKLMETVTQQVYLAFDRKTYPELTEEQVCKHIFDAIYLYVTPIHDKNAEGKNPRENQQNKKEGVK